MPIYTYRCEACEIIFDVHHSMKEIREDCTECETKASLIRVPSLPFIDTKPQLKNEIGSLVRKHIEEGRQEIKKEKEEMKAEMEPGAKND